MTRHHKFSKLTQDFAPERQAKIATKTAQLKESIDFELSSNSDYELISLKLDLKIINWAKQEAEKQGVNYQAIINTELLKLCS